MAEVVSTVEIDRNPIVVPLTNVMMSLPRHRMCAASAHHRDALPCVRSSNSALVLPVDERTGARRKNPVQTQSARCPGEPVDTAG